MGFKERRSGSGSRDPDRRSGMDRRQGLKTQCLSDIRHEEMRKRFLNMCLYFKNRFANKSLHLLISTSEPSGIGGDVPRLIEHLKKVGLAIVDEELDVLPETHAMDAVKDKEYHLIFVENNRKLIKKIKDKKSSVRPIVIAISHGEVQTRAGEDYSISFIPDFV